MISIFNQQQTVSEKFNLGLTLKGSPRDTNLRSNTIAGISRQLNLSEAETEELEKELRPFDLGHIQAISQGGDNNPQNLFFELKNENRSGGLKSEIENGNRLMMISRKLVENQTAFEFDPRIPIRAPVNAQIKRIVRFRNGRLYSQMDYTLDNSPYYTTVTIPLMRKPLVISDLKTGASEVVFYYGGAFTSICTVTHPSDLQEFSRVVASAGKVVLPFVVKTGIKTSLNYLQTSPNVSRDIRKKIAMLNISREFNNALNVSSKLLALKIFNSEIQKNNKTA